MFLTVFGTWNLYALILQSLFSYVLFFLTHALNEMHKTFCQGNQLINVPITK